jgi:hypothetical protein
MARQVARKQQGREVRFVPESMGNRESLPGDQVVVWFTVPYGNDRRLLNSIGSSTKVSRDDKGNPVVNLKDGDILDKHKAAIERHVVRVENYVDGSQAIDTGELFARYADDPFFWEVGGAILASGDLDEKKSEKPPEQSCRAEQVLTSTAGTVAPADCSGTATVMGQGLHPEL